MKKYLIFGLILIIIIAALIIPKILEDRNENVKFKKVEVGEIPEKFNEMLPKYIMEERALVGRYRNEIYVIVTRGEKKSKGFSVDIEDITKKKHSKDKFDIIVHAKFIDPKVDEILPQEYDYPFVIVKTKLKSMPEKVHLDIDYKE